MEAQVRSTEEAARDSLQKQREAFEEKLEKAAKTSQERYAKIEADLQKSNVRGHRLLFHTP